ncbi:MAG TPA: hypothetical protein VFK50_06715 [Sphingomicrobium sp.]|nr:hypothetical protein [Sphingomicrobium sp.]
MIAALSTIAILGLLWLLAVGALALFEENGGKFIAALKGRSPLAMTPLVPPVSWNLSPRVRSARVMRVRPTLRAAA